MGVFRHPATRAIGSDRARLLASFEGLSGDEIVELYETYEAEAIAADLAADDVPELLLEDLL